MKRASLALVGLILATMAAYVWYAGHAAPARARQAAREFMAAAAAGDEPAVTAMLSPDTAVSPTDVIGMYAGMAPGSFATERAPGNRAGVEMLVHVGLADPAGGYTLTTIVAMKRIGDRWVVVAAGPEVMY